MVSLCRAYFLIKGDICCVFVFQRGFKLRSKLAHDDHVDSEELPGNLYIIEQTDQIQGMHALIR